MQGVEQWVEQGRQVLERLTTTRGRLVVTALLLLATVALAALVVPWIVRQVRRALTSRYVDGPVGDAISLLGEYVPTTFSEVALRTLQVALLITAGIALLVVWGLVEPARIAVVALLDALPDLFKAGVTAVLIVVAYVGSDQLKGAVARFAEGAERITDHQEEIMLRVGQMAWLVTVSAAILTLWGVNLSGLLVGAGFLGIVVGLAARQTLGSMIAGFVLMFSRPFTIGDWVEIGGQEGIVTDITIFNTRLENFDGEFVVIPNDTVSDSAVTNRSKKGLLRLRRDVGIDYDADTERAREVALEALGAVDAVVSQPPPQVIPKEFGDSAVVLELRFWIDHPTPPRKWRAVGAVVSAVREAFDEADITIPFPQRTLSDRGTEPRREALAREPED